MNCCDQGYNRIFRGAYVRREAQTFRKRGLDKRQQAFLKQNLKGKSILDIGGGIGALSLTALQQGASRAQLIEISSDYLKTANTLSKAMGFQEQLTLQQGDFMLLSAEVSNIVVLDRVVCCYPDATGLLAKAALHSREYLIYTEPTHNWFSWFAKTLINTSMWLVRNPYRFFRHSSEELEKAATGCGHELVQKTQFGFWQLNVFHLMRNRQAED